MKKAIIATAVVLVLSFVSTVCFGVALGSQGLRAFFRDGGVLDEWSGAVSDWNDALLYTDALADTDERENLFSNEGTLLEAVDSLKITANCGKVRVLQGTGEQVEVSLRNIPPASTRRRNMCFPFRNRAKFNCLRHRIWTALRRF